MASETAGVGPRERLEWAPMRAFLVALAWTSSALLAPVVATAQDAELDEDARLHFELGTRAYDRGEFTTAVEEFGEAYRLSGRPALLYNMYVALRDAQQREEAAEMLRRYLREAGDIPNRARLEVVLEQLEAELRGEPPPPEPRTTSHRAPPPSPSADPDVTGPAVILGLGGALLVASAITGGLAIARNGDLSSACPGDVCPEDARGIQSDVETLSITTDVLWPIGAVAAGVGLIWLIVELGGGDQPAASASCDPNGCFGSVRGTF